MQYQAEPMGQKWQSHIIRTTSTLCFGASAPIARVLLSLISFVHDGFPFRSTLRSYLPDSVVTHYLCLPLYQSLSRLGNFGFIVDIGQEPHLILLEGTFLATSLSFNPSVG